MTQQMLYRGVRVQRGAPSGAPYLPHYFHKRVSCKRSTRPLESPGLKGHDTKWCAHVIVVVVVVVVVVSVVVVDYFYAA